MNENKLILNYDLPMSVNHYTSVRAFMMNGKPQTSVYVTTESKKYKKDFVNYIKEQINLQNFEVKLGKFQFTHVDAIWYFPRIDMDSNNYWKLPLDCLTEAGIWEDDNTTLERCKRIFYDSQNPHMILEIYYSDYIGIFDTQSQFEEFESNCTHCSRYKNGKCSIFNKVTESRIQEDIQDFKCNKFKEIKSKILKENK